MKDKEEEAVIKVKIPAPLWRLTGGRKEVEVSASNLSQCIDELERLFPGIKERLLDDKGEIQQFVDIFVNGEDINFLQGLQTLLKPGDEVSIVPAIAGGIFI